MRKRELITIRPGELSDRAFVFSTWLKGLRYSNKWFGLIDEYIYFSEYHRIIEKILSKPSTKIHVATLIEDPGIILGYSVQEPDTLHWVFVKPDWRGIGLCSDLVGNSIKFVTHMTKKGSVFNKKGVTFNPIYWVDNKKEQ